MEKQHQPLLLSALGLVLTIPMWPVDPTVLLVVGMIGCWISLRRRMPPGGGMSP